MTMQLGIMFFGLAARQVVQLGQLVIGNAPQGS